MRISGRSKWAIMRMIVLLAVIGSVAFVYYRRTRLGRDSEAARPGDLTIRVQSIPVTDDLALGSFVVPSRQTHEVKITVDGNRMRNARLAGHFSVQNGPAIQVMLLDQEQYAAFRKDAKPGNFDYLSRKTTDGNIDVSIPHTGMYYIIFDNSSGESASVTVKADVTLRYETVQVSR
jgi:hypothetical protein